MGRIVSATFGSQDEADRGADALANAGFARSSIAVFYLTPPREEWTLPAIDVDKESDGAEDAGTSSGSGAAIGAAVGGALGAAASPVLGPLGIAGGVGIGAYAGSLYGALGGMKDEKEDPRAQAAVATSDPELQHDAAARIREGMRVVVEVSGPEATALATGALESNGGGDVVTTDGRVVDGALVD